MFAYEVNKNYITLIKGKVVKANGVEVFRTKTSTIPMRKIKFELDEIEKSIYAEGIRNRLIEDAQFEMAKDETLKKQAKKWIVEAKSKTHEQLIAEYESEAKRF
jgi:hypothetical protein